MLEGLVLGAHLFTTHVGCASNCRYNTPGIYLKQENGMTLGVYNNTFGRTSAYAAWTFETADGRFALTAGGVTGYLTAKVMPLISPSVKFDLGNRVSLRLVFLPRAPIHGGVNGLHMALEHSF